MKKIDMQGKTFSRLTVRSSAGVNKWGQALYNAECSCGSLLLVLGKSLRNGHTQSCGCLHKEELSKRNVQDARHGMTGTPTHKSWKAMVQRCTDIRTIDFKNYGGKCCDSWLIFENFLKDMGERPEGTTLGRTVDRGNYESGNAFWMTQAEQNLAKRNNNALRKWEACQL